MSELRTAIDQAVATLRRKCNLTPSVAIILGTGLGALAQRIKQTAAVAYSDIPGFVKPTVESHGGELIFGELGGKPVVAMKGRFHHYEGYTAQQIAFPVRVMRALGARTLIVSNASGLMNPQWRKGDLMLIDDHINLMGINPLIGPNDSTLGLRFPDMSQPYDRELMSLAQSIALKEGIRLQRGVYVAVTGPNLETRAEYRFLRGIDADVVGMSTVPEVIVAVHAGFKVLGVSVTTDECFPDALHPAKLEDILEVAGKADQKLSLLVTKVIEQLN